ncbi:50S ribosomal protein L34e [Candidatus Woesearchaeota archaeon]|nr:50S ribosomal protein L34e [Candidatus Woesearchaeota archaeon]
MRGRYKNRTFKRKRITLPGGRRTIHYGRGKTGKAECADCGTTLKGTVRGFPSQIQKMSKTERRPERPYGGVLCSKCTRTRMIEKAQEIAKQITGE